MKTELVLPIVCNKYNISYIIFDENFRIIDFTKNMQSFLDSSSILDIELDVREFFWEFVGLEEELENIITKKKEYLYIPLMSRNELFYDINLELCKIEDNQYFIAMFSKQLNNSISYLDSIKKINEDNLRNHYDKSVSENYYNLINKKLISFHINNLGMITKVNSACIYFFGLSEDNFIGKHFSDYFLSRQIKSKNSFIDNILRAKDKNSEEIFFHADIIPLDNNQNSDKIVICQDITYLKKIESELEYASNHDSLTGLANRANLEKNIEELISKCEITKDIFAICFIDLNKFKAINDTLGHHAGDMFLKHIADILRSGVREDDFISRLGGDEFVVLIKNLESLEFLDKAISRFKTIASKSPLYYNEKTILEVSFSFGVSIYPYDGEDIETLLSVADKKMYQDKKRS